jgi:rabenosyn-5
MLPLRSLPKLLRHASSHAEGSGTTATTPHGPSALRNGDTASIASSGSAVSALEGEEKALRERSIVLEEQRFFVGEMMRDATSRRRWDEVGVLKTSLAELEAEIGSVEGELRALDWEGAYGNGDGTAVGET